MADSLPPDRSCDAGSAIRLRADLTGCGLVRTSALPADVAPRIHVQRCCAGSSRPGCAGAGGVAVPRAGLMASAAPAAPSGSCAWLSLEWLPLRPLWMRLVRLRWFSCSEMGRLLLRQRQVGLPLRQWSDPVIGRVAG